MPELPEKTFLLQDHRGRGVAGNPPRSPIREYCGRDFKKDEEVERKIRLENGWKPTTRSTRTWIDKNNCAFTHTE
jgi:hypothetical protein